MVVEEISVLVYGRSSYYIAPPQQSRKIQSLREESTGLFTGSCDRQMESLGYSEESLAG